MSNLARTQPTSGLAINSTTDLECVAGMMAKSGYFSDARDVAQCAVKIMAGLELGIPTFASMTGIHIIQGKPTMGANLMAAAIKRSGKYDYRVVEHTNETCKIAFFEKKEKIGESEFSIADAKAIMVWNAKDKRMKPLYENNPVWRSYPKNMTFARCISNGIRWFFPDLFLGPVYTADEMGAETDGEGNIVTVQAIDSTQEVARQPQIDWTALRESLGFSREDCTAIRETAGVSPGYSQDPGQSTILRNTLLIEWGLRQGKFNHYNHALNALENVLKTAGDEQQSVITAWFEYVVNHEDSQSPQMSMFVPVEQTQ